MKLVRALAVLASVFVLGACSDDGPTEVTAVFVDSTVAGLGYECGSDDTRLFTNAAGEFTCNAGEEVRFYLGEILLGSFDVARGLEAVTPGMLTGASMNEMMQMYYGDFGGPPSPELFSAIYMATILQGFDDDEDPENGIVISPAVHALFDEPAEWDYDGEAPSPVLGALFDELEDLEVEIPDEEDVFEHLVAQGEKLLHGLYTGSVVEDGDTIQVDLFVFNNPGGGESAGPGLQARLVISDMDDIEPLVVHPGEPIVDLNDVILIVDYSLDGVTIRVYDVEGLMQNEVDVYNESDEIDYVALAPYILHEVPLEKIASSPDVTMRDVGEFLAELPNGDDVPEDLEEHERPRVGIEAYTPEPEMVEGPGAVRSQGGGMYLWGHTKKLGLEGGFSDFGMPGGHLILASLDDSTLVYRGRIFVVYEDDGDPEPEEVVTWGDATVTINVDGTLELSIDGDDGSSFSETLEVDYASVGEPR